MTDFRQPGPVPRTFSRRSAPLALFSVVSALSLALGCASEQSGGPVASTTKVQPAPGKGDDFLVVDCLLPGQVRRLGQQLTFLTARRPVKTSARDCEIRGGEYAAFDRADYATALKVWLGPAEQGDAAAATYVGEIFEKGLGLPPDYAAAAQWYRRAAASGSSRAAINLGSLYERGLGVARDPRQALSWYQRAAGMSKVAFEVLPGKPSADLRALQDQIAGLREELRAKQSEIDKVRGDVEASRKALEERRAQADADRSSLLRLRQELAELQALDQTASARLGELRREISDGEGRVLARDGEIAQLRQSLARAEADSRARNAAQDREIAVLRDKLSRAEAEGGAQRAGLERLTQQTVQAGPRIDLVQIQLLDSPAASSEDAETRSLPASADGPAMTLLLIGRVVSAAGIKSITVNQREEKIDSENIFRSRIPLTAASRAVKIVARDRNDHSATMEFLTPPSPASRAEAAGGPGSAAAPAGTAVRRPAVSLGNYHALVIGNNAYRQLPPLRTAVGDAQAVARVLREQYKFQVMLLTDATRYQILSALNVLREKLNSTDNLLIYYAGHGMLDERNLRGHWLPVDAEPNSTANWIANSDITAILNIMEVRQLLLVADSCYSGTLTRSAVGQLEPGMTPDELHDAIRRMGSARSRMVMTSGGLEPVVDSGGRGHSVFSEVFLQVLTDNNGMLLGREAFRRLQLRVAAMAERLSVLQVPEYAPIQFAGHEAGDFVFVRSGS
jgi:Caspase domain/Sel1 repeat